MDTLILIHRIVGYPTAFIVAPVGLLAFTRAGMHRSWGKAFFYGMLFLYGTGTVLTLTQHDWGTWTFARNVAFNFFGFSMVLYGYRAIRLFRRPGEIRPGRLDRGMAWLLTVSVLGLLAVAVFKDTPMRVFALIGIGLCVLEWREVRQDIMPKALLYRRHQRYVLASFFYVLTVVSLVHLGDELPRETKWLWPSVLGLLVIWLLTGRSRSGEAGAGVLPGVPRGRLTRWVVTAVVAGSLLFGGYIMYDLAAGRTISSQGEQRGR